MNPRKSNVNANNHGLKIIFRRHGRLELLIGGTRG